ncbi:MAG: DUF4932 domain-containing protein [Fidelibacterota bacterium]|nr:MAG: DUF4932 domain-containing protein [Candidatus Neomarinimicrobiota bacterium]
MRKLIVLLIGLACLQPACSTTASQRAGRIILPTPVEETVASVHIMVHPNVELISIIQHISKYGETFPFLLNNNDFRYREDIVRQFRQHSDHDAIRFMDDVSLKPRMYNFSAPPTSMLYLDESFRLREDLVHDDFLMARIGGVDSLRRFGEYLGDYSQQAGFAEFYAEHAAYYKSLVDSVKSKFDEVNYVEELEAFYGTRQESYNLILVPLYGHVGFGPHVDSREGDTHIFNIMGPQSVESGVLNFGDKSYFKKMQRHEFSHSFVNPLTEKYWDEAVELAYLFERLPETARKEVCGDWQECLNEHVVRAVTTYLAYMEGEETGRKAREYEIGRGMIFLDDLMTAIRVYESKRDQYPTFDSYYDELLAALRKHPKE